MNKVRYEVDPYNRLVASGLSKFRKVLDGQFKTGQDNNLSYHIKAPLSTDDNIPNQIKLKGEWSLTDDHLLRLTLDKSSRKTFGDSITLQGEILDVKENSLLFAVTTTRKGGAISTYVLNLGGVWRADKNNRLSFYIRKEKGKYDVLTFTCAWEINKNNQIVYKYEKADLLKKKKRVSTLTFKGYWDIKDALRISYVMSKDTESAFNFETSAGIFKDDHIKYELGIRLDDKIRPVRRIITLFGAWNLKKDVGLVFEIKYYPNLKIKEIIFGADARLTDRDTVVFKLKSDVENRDIGIELELSRKILRGDGQVFLRALTSRRESTIYAGGAWAW